MLLQILKAASIVLSGALGVLAAISELRTANRLTRSGKTLIGCFLASIVITLGLQYAEVSEQRGKDIAAAQQLNLATEKQALVIERLEALLQQQRMAVLLTQRNLQSTQMASNKVDATLERSTLIHNQTESTLRQTREANDGIAKLLHPFRVAAVEWTTTHPLSDPRLAAFKKRVIQYIASDCRATCVHPAGSPFLRYQGDRVVGLDIPNGSTFFPSIADGGVAASLSESSIMLGFYRVASLTDRFTVDKSDFLIVPEVRFDPKVESRYRYSRERREFEIRNDLFVDLERDLIVQTALALNPTPIRNTFKIDTFADIARGGICIVIPFLLDPPNASYRPGLDLLRLYTDSSMATFYQIPLERLELDPAGSGVLWFHPVEKDLQPQTLDLSR